MATISASPAVSLGALRSGLDARRPVRPTTPDAASLVERPAVHSVTLAPRVQRLLLALLAVFAVSLAAPAVAGAIGGSGQPGAGVTALGPVESAAFPAYTVLPGDTLWSIAEEVNPHADPRGVVLQLRVLNGLGGDHVLRPGEVLQVPSL